MRVQRLATAPVFAEILKVWGAISSKPLVRLASNVGFGAVGSQITCIPMSLKSESVGFKFSVILGDLTRNDPKAIYLGVTMVTYLTFVLGQTVLMKCMHVCTHVHTHTRTHMRRIANANIYLRTYYVLQLRSHSDC